MVSGERQTLRSSLPVLGGHQGLVLLSAEVLNSCAKGCQLLAGVPGETWAEAAHELWLFMELAGFCAASLVKTG